jgi:putative redox protein
LDTAISTDDTRLVAHVAHPPVPGATPAVVLCHGFPTGPRGAVASATTFPELADRIAREIGCIAVAFNFRGTGGSAGDFSVNGWLDDIAHVLDDLDGRPEAHGVVLVGVAEGGTLALCAGAADERVVGVATLAASTTLRDWGRDPGRFLDYARRVGMVRTDGFPESLTSWGREIAAIDAEAAARALAPRPVLVLHGSDDAVVDPSDARAIAAAGGPWAELRLVQSAGHELRHDPRAVAALLGWLERLP